MELNELATVDDLAVYWRKLSAEEQERASLLIPMVCDTLRMEAQKVGKDLDSMLENGSLLPNVAKLVILDILVRTLDQLNSDNSFNLSQESQSANGYSWSGSYVNTGGGVGILAKDLKRLGLKKQKYGFLDLYGIGGFGDD